MFPRPPDAEQAHSPKRLQIVAGAALVFAESGYDGASMSRIAHHAGVSKGTLYNYFDSKSALFAAFVEREAAERVAWVFQTADEDTSVDEFLRGVARRLIGSFMSEAFQMLHRIVLSEAGKFPHLAAIYFETGYQRGCRELASWLGAQAELGTLSVPDPLLAAEQFAALCRTRLWIRRCLDVGGEPDAGDIDAIAGSSVAMFLNTYRAGLGEG
jgi:AcrR family transcriptional regulator